MFDKIIAFSIKNKVTIGLMTLLLIIWGIYSAWHLPIDAQPDITNNQVQIISQAPNLGAQEVEQFITAPIELSMANIPNLIEKRSISRSGISVVTLVFKDETDVYWARQQVGAQLKEAENNIPKGLAEPMLAPITTGLGEIYQYVLHTKKGFEGKYSATDLRTIQDWLVRTQLAGTKGVAEVSGWGGYVKQYEVALDNDKLNSFGITIPEVFTALENNNENTGGSYIEQQSNAYFIRGIGQVKTLEDISKIVVRNTGGSPILIRDIAKVQFGSATRYGAVTRNGNGEVVAGVTLMLKGENFNEVIKNVKEKIVQIQKSLPEGVVIEPYIDRTELVGRAIGTVKRNLLEGALIVVLALVILLGNWRAGLVVASVIPLAMLFAFAMMRLFGVSGNLMSLGAIDFGLIVDGAVIIVEAIIFRLTENNLFPEVKKLNQQQMDDAVYQASSKIRNSAAFGEIIILIVYLPLLALVGIEGKMFRPMAQTVVFAIVGAFLLSLTYVPMVSSLLLSKKTEHNRNLSDRLIEFLQRIYEKALIAILKVKRLTVTMVFIAFAITLWAFSRMGGEFIPTLEEGDLTVEISMMQGTSLSEVVKTFGKAEKILKTGFPELKQAVTRIGSSEIPTDPMPIERGDMMLAMKPKGEWTTATTKEEMIEKMEEALAVLPGINVEITQPMQMRFNELMTGIRQDVAVKIYGDDLDVLKQNADRIASLIAPVEGVSEPYVEKVNGLPQIVVEYNRDKISQYGLNIADLNTVLKTAFAGNKAGTVYEGEKRFDLVVRLQKNLRENISSVQNLLVPLPSGNKVPLSQVAAVHFKDAPAQVSREDGKRRIYVGFNVRGRDVERTVMEIKNLINKNIRLPAGYYVTYGGQFQNLQAAKDRLSIAVPAALTLIIILLYLTFRSVKQSLLIFSAVPLAAIGGVAALLIRDMPFSISAGVGFIALFGVAVLNGVVLIGYFNDLEKEGIADVYERVLKGTRVRLRPVLMTAAVASLGFLPMALSTSAGAEVQRPLATVVIGGLITATFLTLFVLPCLYILFLSKVKNKVKVPKVLVLLLISTGLSFTGLKNVKAQTRPLTLDSLLSISQRNNLQLKSSSLASEQAHLLEGTYLDLPKTELIFTQDPTGNKKMDNSIGITQSFAWPGFYRQQNRLLKAQTKLTEGMGNYNRAEITKMVKSAYYEYLIDRETISLLNVQDSLYQDFLARAKLRYQSGETSKLELLNANNKTQEIRVQKISAAADLQRSEVDLMRLLNIRTPLNIANDKNLMIELTNKDTLNLNRNKQLNYVKQIINVADAKLQLEKSKLMPDITFGYNQHLSRRALNPGNISENNGAGPRISGFQAGISLPLFGGATRSRIKSHLLANRVAETNYLVEKQNIEADYQQEMQLYLKYKQRIDYYKRSALSQSDEQLRIARISFNLGEIGYIEYLQNIAAAIQIKMNYLEDIKKLNTSALQIQFLKGEQ